MTDKLRAGRLIAIEGIDASGKSSVANEIVATLARRGVRSLLVSRRTVPLLSTGYVRDHLRELASLIWEYPQDAHTTELGLWHWTKLLGAWYCAVDYAVVRPALSDGATVVADSWIYKYIARFALEMDMAKAFECFANISTPHRVVWLDIAPSVCAARRAHTRATERGEWISGLGGQDSFVEYQGRVRAVYGNLAESGTWQIVTSLDAPMALAERISIGLVKSGTATS